MCHLFIVPTGLLKVRDYHKPHQIKHSVLEADACVDQISSTEDKMKKSDLIKRFDISFIFASI